LALSSTETASFLRSIAVANDAVSAIGSGPKDTRQDLAYFLVRDWILVGYWGDAEFLYLDMVVSPQGEVGRYGEWRSEGTQPEDMLSSIEFAWLWGKLDTADVIGWTDILAARMKAAGRV